MFEQLLYLARQRLFVHATHDGIIVHPNATERIKVPDMGVLCRGVLCYGGRPGGQLFHIAHSRFHPWDSAQHQHSMRIFEALYLGDEPWKSQSKIRISSFVLSFPQLRLGGMESMRLPREKFGSIIRILSFVFVHHQSGNREIVRRLVML